MMEPALGRGVVSRLARRLAAALLLTTAACDTGPPAVRIPQVSGPLALTVVHPAPGARVAAQESAYLIGSVGNGAATLSVNGTPVSVRPNGSFLAYLPLPPAHDPAYRLVAALGGDTARRTLPVRLPGGPPPPPGRMRVDTASLLPRGPLRLRADERVRVAVRAPGADSVWVETLGAGRHPLRSNTAPAGSGNPSAARRRDPGRWAGDLPRDALTSGAALVARGGGETVRLPLPAAERAEAGRPRWVVLGGAGGEEGREIVGRPSPDGPYRWFFLPGTRVEVTGAVGELLRVRLDPGQEAWVAAEQATPAAAPSAPAPLPAGAPRLRPAAGWVDVVVPVSAPVPYQVQQGARALSLVLHGVAMPESGPRKGATADPYARELRTGRDAPGRERLILRLGAAPFGYQVFWSGGEMVLRVRRPPAVRPGRPLEGLVVAVDAGHPPHGAIGPTGLREAGVTLAVARRLRGLLEERGARVVMTRDGGAAVSLETRVARAVRGDAHALVSLHADALTDGLDPRRVNGTATFFFHPQSARLASAVQRGAVARMGRQDRGAHRKNLALVRPTWMPAVLCEGAMIVLPEEEEALRTPAFQEAYARGIADGLEEYFRALAEEGES